MFDSFKYYAVFGKHNSFKEYLDLDESEKKENCDNVKKGLYKTEYDIEKVLKEYTIVKNYNATND